jgi:hypothetical protein
MARFRPRLGDGGQGQSVRTGRRPPRSGALAGGAELRQRAVMPLSPPRHPNGDQVVLTGVREPSGSSHLARKRPRDRILRFRAKHVSSSLDLPLVVKPVL